MILAQKRTRIKLYDVNKTKVNLIHAYDVSTAVLKSLQNGITGTFNLGNYNVKNYYNIAVIFNQIFKNKKKITIVKKNTKLSLTLLIKLHSSSRYNF